MPLTQRLSLPIRVAKSSCDCSAGSSCKIDCKAYTIDRRMAVATLKDARPQINYECVLAQGNYDDGGTNRGMTRYAQIVDPEGMEINQALLGIDAKVFRPRKERPRLALEFGV